MAATDVRVNFTLNTTDPDGAPIQESRYYYVYRPDNLPKTTPIPLVIFMEASPNSGGATFFHRKADQAGFVVVAASFSGNNTGTPGTSWNAQNPRSMGLEDFDYISEVINRVKDSDNVNDVFVVGFSKGGHMTLAYTCERPSTLKAAASIDEFMLLDSNIPTVPVPIMMFHGTVDGTVPYTMVRDTLDVWRAVDGLSNATPVTTYESSPLIPNSVSQATWRGGINGTQVAFVTIIGGDHNYPTQGSQTGYDFTDGLWAFFSQYLTSAQSAPKIVSQPVNNTQISGQPASFWVTATGNGPIGYQWQKNGVDIPGATANWYTLPASTAGDNGATFRAVATNGAGSATSATATLTVKPAPAGPAITTQPADQAVIGGQPVSFTATATGTPPLSYQWQKNGIDIAGETAASLTMRAAISADCGASFRVVVTNATGATVSDRATLTVTPAPSAPIILANPVRPYVVAGTSATWSVNAWSLSPMGYQWQKGTLTGLMTDIPGATGATYTTPSTTLNDNLTLFRCIVSNAAGNRTSASDMLFVTAQTTAPIRLGSPITASAQVGMPFQYTMIFTGGTPPFIYSASPMPAGLSLNPSSGVISGTPTATGTTEITIAAGNSAGHVSRILTLGVMDTPPPVSIASWRLANFGASAVDPSIAGDMADPDGDDYPNVEEFTGGSNPLDPASVPSPRQRRFPRH